MNHKPDLPDSWAMPDDLAKKVSEALNRKPITPEDKLQDALDEMGRDIAMIEPDPMDCANAIGSIISSETWSPLSKLPHSCMRQLMACFFGFGYPTWVILIQLGPCPKLERVPQPDRV